MSNGLITSFFSSLPPRNDPSTVENEDTGQDQDFHEAEGNGVTLDLAGLLQSSCDDGKTKKKKKRSHRKRGHVHLAKLSEEDDSISLGAMEEKSVVCEEVSILEPDDGVVWLSPLKQESPLKATVKQQQQVGGGGSLSESWKQVFCRTQKKSPVKKSVGSPKRCRSPRRPSMSPKRCQSPRQRLVQKQVQKSSPLKQQHTVKRQLLTTPTNSNKLLPLDHAPFTGLVHVQQINNINTSMHHHLCLPIRSLLPYTPQAVASSLGISDHQPFPITTPFFEAIADPSTCLDQFQRDYPHFCVSDIYSRYFSLTRRSSTDPSPFSDANLPCSVSVRVERDGRILVDCSAYPKQPPLHDHMHSDLWSSVYRPQASSEVIGNSKQCSGLCSWLKRWKHGGNNSEPAPSVIANKQGSRKQCCKSTKVNEWWYKDRDEDFIPPEKVNLSKGRSGLCQRYLSGDGGSSEEEESGQDEDGKEGETSVLLLCGPHGAGKTAAVYAAADQLGFRVFEVNSSMARGRSQLLASLREVTLSHLVAQRKRNGFTYLHGNQQQAIALEANTLILLEDVDVLFDEHDRGFWSAVYEIIESTKRPLIITSSDASMDLSCPHSKLIFSRPTAAELALHIRLLSLAHGVSLSSESASQIVASFNCDIRRTFHYMHTWLSWYPSNSVEAPPTTSSQLSPSYSILADWRNVSTFAPHPPTSASETTTIQFELLQSASVADHLATLDLLTAPEAADSSPSSLWWRVAPDNHLLDELSKITPTDTMVAQTKHDIVVELSRLSTALPHNNQRSLLELHNSFKTCTQVFSLNWRLARVAIVTEGIPFLRLISILEEQKRSLSRKRRFHHYLQNSNVAIHHLNLLAKSTFV